MKDEGTKLMQQWSQNNFLSAKIPAEHFFETAVQCCVVSAQWTFMTLLVQKCRTSHTRLTKNIKQ
jgi:hypothetical protein